MKSKLKRGVVRKADAEFVGVWFPKGIAALIDRAVRDEDTDRSKFVRNAVKEKLEGAR